MLRRVAPAAAVAAVLAAVPAVAAADPGIGAPTSFKAAFTTRHPDRSAGLKLKTTGAPPVAPRTEAPAVRQTVVLPRGARLDLAKLPQCHAGAQALAAEGAEAACAPGTRLGTGRAEGIAAGATVGFDLSVYAIDGRLFFAGEQGGMPLKTGFYGVADGRRLVLTVPTRDGAIAPTLFEATLHRATRGSAWLRTPKRCPRGGHWTAKGVFQGLDAVGGMPVGAAATVQDRQACTR